MSNHSTEYAVSEQENLVPNWPEIILAIEETLFPHYKCDVWERSHYYYLLYQTRLKDVEVATVPLSQISGALFCSEFSSRKILRKLAQKGCIELDQTRRGHCVKVMLPSELPIPQPNTEPEGEIDIEAIDFFKGRDYVHELIDRENGQCFYCLKKIDPESCELDHVIPQVSDGNNSYRNVVASCHRCNTQKQGQEAKSHLRALLRSDMLSEKEFEARIDALEALQNGHIRPKVRAAAR